jgi:hypothetical protein
VSDVVLIHSTGQGAAGWERVVHALTERGQTAHAVELPSDPDLLAADYAGLIRRHLGAIATPIVLAHSGAGPLLPATARVLQACHQVWLAAWVPDPEASFVEDTDLHAQAAFNPDWIGKDPTRPAAMPREATRQTGRASLLIRRLQVGVLPGPDPPVTGLYDMLCSLEWQPTGNPMPGGRVARRPP